MTARCSAARCTTSSRSGTTLLWNGNYEGALQRLLKTSPFPEFTARVCPALCEKACVCGRVSQPVTVRENELAIIEYAFENDLMQPMPPAARSDKRIAVVGSGRPGSPPPIISIAAATT